MARLNPALSKIIDQKGQVEITLTLSRPVPFRVIHLQKPPRLAVELQSTDLSGLQLLDLSRSDHVVDGAAGLVDPKTSRLVLQFDRPFVVEAVRTALPSEALRVVVALRPSSEAELAERALRQADQSKVNAAPIPSQTLSRQDGSRPLRVMLDPGHGGIDPGALAGDLTEAQLILGFAKDLQRLLQEAGMEAFLTRDGDYYVSLERRVALAQQAQADLMLSLHADAADDESASGSKAYTISEEASDRLSKLLIRRQERAAMLSGVDLTAQDDAVADVLVDLARHNTLPRSRALADAIIGGLQATVGDLHSRPRSEASFSVLKAAEVPSVLLELGFLSNPNDLERLTDPVWQGRAQQGILKALQAWAKDDAAEAVKLRR
ncbi:N-acetylmuramoyl-L-alanine amidase [Actibacterium pelagium]|uniref:N-acetylmuramoyl-L-alanine amidase n=1 Tax=Actibacterium pelagium TaxID=2029103 RepID=UPI00166A2533|nr:N-acetylmuramoyl-L-alanine amidase [Actibacterium pelagium]